MSGQPEHLSTLAQAFKASGLKQRELAHKLKTGETQVSRWLREERSPHPELWRPRIAKALGVKVDQIKWKERENNHDGS